MYRSRRGDLLITKGNRKTVRRTIDIALLLLGLFRNVRHVNARVIDVTLKKRSCDDIGISVAIIAAQTARQLRRCIYYRVARYTN